MAVVLRAIYVLVARQDVYATVDNGEYSAMANDLLAGRGLVEHIGFVRPPIYPLFLAACVAIGGIAFLQVVQIAISATTAILIGRLAELLYSERKGANWAAALAAAVYPWSFPYVGVIATETLFTFLAVASFGGLLVAARRTSGSASVVGAGAIVGLAALARANVLFLAPFLALWLAWRARSIRTAGLWTAGLIIALAPFAAFNVWAGNGLVIASSGGGMNFYLGNNPEHARLFLADLTDEEWRRLSFSSTPAYDFSGCRVVSAASDLCAERASLAERERYFYGEGLRYVRTHTTEWASMVASKFVTGLRPWVEPRAYGPAAVMVSGISFTVIAALAIAGMLRMPRGSAALVFLIVLASTTAMALYVVQLRYRAALVDPVLIAAAGEPLAAFLLSAWRRSGSLVPRTVRTLTSTRPG